MNDMCEAVVVLGWIKELLAQNKPERVTYFLALEPQNLNAPGCTDARWKAAAMRLGEQLASVGPENYYDMTPEQWLGWCENTINHRDGDDIR